MAAALIVLPARAQAPDAAQPMVPISQVIRQAGYTLSDAEANYLDSEQQLQVQWVSPLYQVVALAGTEGALPDAASRASINSELQKLLALDPTGGPAAPPQYARLRELAISQRQALQRAARLWLAGLDEGDPDWRQRATAEAEIIERDLQAWGAEIASRYPPPPPPESTPGSTSSSTP